MTIVTKTFALTPLVMGLGMSVDLSGRNMHIKFHFWSILNMRQLLLWQLSNNVGHVSRKVFINESHFLLKEKQFRTNNFVSNYIQGTHHYEQNGRWDTNFNPVFYD